MKTRPVMPSPCPLGQVPMKNSPVMMLNERPAVSRVQREQSQQRTLTTGVSSFLFFAIIYVLLNLFYPIHHPCAVCQHTALHLLELEFKSCQLYFCFFFVFHLCMIIPPRRPCMTLWPSVYTTYRAESQKWLNLSMGSLSQSPFRSRFHV